MKLDGYLEVMVLWQLLRAEQILSKIRASGKKHPAGNDRDGCWLWDGWVGGLHKRAADVLLPLLWEEGN